MYNTIESQLARAQMTHYIFWLIGAFALVSGGPLISKLDLKV